MVGDDVGNSRTVQIFRGSFGRRPGPRPAGRAGGGCSVQTCTCEFVLSCWIAVGGAILEKWRTRAGRFFGRAGAPRRFSAALVLDRPRPSGPPSRLCESCRTARFAAGRVPNEVDLKRAGESSLTRQLAVAMSYAISFGSSPARAPPPWPSVWRARHSKGSIIPIRRSVCKLLCLVVSLLAKHAWRGLAQDRILSVPSSRTVYVELVWLSWPGLLGFSVGDYCISLVPHTWRKFG